MDFCSVLATIAAFIKEHEGVLGLLVLAFIASMPEELCSPWNRVPTLAFLYSWIHDGLKTFVSFRAPRPPVK